MRNSHIKFLVFIGLISYFLIFVSCAATMKNVEAKNVSTEEDDGGFINLDGYLLHWQKTSFPIDVYVPYEDDRLKRNTLVACRFWNYVVHHPLFEVRARRDFEKDDPEKDFILVGREDVDDAHIAVAKDYEHEEGKLKSVSVVVDDEAKLYLDRVMVHELGHALGLAHDKNRRSIMYPTTIANYTYAQFIMPTDKYWILKLAGLSSKDHI